MSSAAAAGGYPAASGPLVDLLASVMAGAGAASSSAEAQAAEMPAEKSKEELATLSKEERTAYHKARQAAAKAQPKAAANAGLTKAQIREKARAKQDEDRKRKEDEAGQKGQDSEYLEELKLQGLTEDQAREVLAQMAVAVTAEEAEDEDDDEDESLLGSVRTWMKEHSREKDITDAESVRDFNLKVRFQGHVDSTPPDHLGAILHVLAAGFGRVRPRFGQTADGCSGKGPAHLPQMGIPAGRALQEVRRAHCCRHRRFLFARGCRQRRGCRGLRSHHRLRAGWVFDGHQSRGGIHF